MPGLGVARVLAPASGLHHQPGRGHPESPARLRAVLDALPEAWQRQAQVAPAPESALRRVHSAAHVARVMRLRDAGSALALDPDTVGDADSLVAALDAAGAGLAAVAAVLGGEAARVFCAVRPPGHHAEPDRAMGFCFFNNIAVAAAQALAEGLQRLAILDFDVHYGNGSSRAFADDPRVLVCQTYQQPFYPYWQGLDRDHIIDCPLAAGSDGQAMRDAVQQQWAPALAAHRPELILVSAGFDAHRADPLAELCWQTSDYGWLGDWLGRQAAQHCGGRAVAFLEGGYDTDALGRSVRDFLIAWQDAGDAPEGGDSR